MPSPETKALHGGPDTRLHPSPSLSSPAASSHTATKEELSDDPQHSERGGNGSRGQGDAVGKVKRRHWWSKDKVKAAQDEQEGCQPSNRYLPLVSAVLCPFSVLLDIPGLTERWYIKTDGFKVIETRPNPIILDVGQAISLFFGVVANAALVARFLEKRPLATTWIAIVSLGIHDVLNIVICSVFGAVHAVDDGFTFGVAFWLTVAGTLASLACSATLVADLVLTKDFRNAGSGLTTKQRSLVIAVMAFLCYIALGALCYSYLIPELAFIDAMYFVVCTISSVGFGDIVPKTIAAKVFTFPYAVGGLALLAFLIAIARETVLESFEASYSKRRDALAHKAKERREQKRRRLRAEREKREKELRERAESGLSPLEDGIRHHSSFSHSHSHRQGGVNFVPVMTRAGAQRRLDFIAEKEGGMSTPRALWRWMLRRLGRLKAYTPSREETMEVADPDEDDRAGAALSRSTSTTSAMSAAAIEERYASFRKDLKREQSKEFRTKITISLSLFLVFWLGGAGVFHATEDWTYFDALWFSFVYFTTIGYGDFSPKSEIGRAFFIAWALFGIANVTLLISIITETWSARYKSTINDGKIRRRLKRAEMKSGDHQNVSRLLALEDYMHEDEVDVKDLPQKLMDAVKGFHDHASFFLLGRTGDPPERYQNLVHAAETDEEFSKMLETEALAAESGGNSEVRHLLFMVAYEREFDTLSAAAAQLTAVFEKHAEELETMRKLNTQLRQALVEKSGSTDEDDKLIAEQEAEDQELEAEELEEERASRSSGSRPTPNVLRVAQATKCNTLDTSTGLLDSIGTFCASASTSTRRQPSNPSTRQLSTPPSPSTPTASTSSQAGVVGSTSILTFAEPDKTTRRESSGSGSGSGGRKSKVLVSYTNDL